MRVIFERCQDQHPEILKMAQEIMEQYHEDLKTPDGGYVQLCIMLAVRGGEHDGKPLLMLHNWPVQAYIKPIPYIQIEKDKHGAIVTDDVGRPRTNMKPHDYELSGFRSVARRWGRDAAEVIQAMRFEEDFGRDLMKPQETPLFAQT